MSPPAPVSSVICFAISSALRSACWCGSPPEPVSSVTLCARSSCAAPGSLPVPSRGLSFLLTSPAPARPRPCAPPLREVLLRGLGIHAGPLQGHVLHHDFPCLRRLSCLCAYLA